MARIYAPKADNSIVDCFLEYQIINDMFMNVTNLVLDLLDLLLPAWLMTMNKYN